MKKVVLFIFLAALAVRLLYFPGNVYFAFDQARDSYTALEILAGDFKILGPPSAASEKLFAGPLIYYVLAAIYFFFDRSPEAASVFFRVFNALGVFLVFLLGAKIFDKKTGLVAAFLYAVSYEEAQYSLFLSHQPLAVLPVLLFYLGLALAIFKKDKRGVILATLGLGLAIQSHYVYILLIPILVILVILFHRQIFPLKLKTVLTASAVLLLTLSTYILAELKFNFRFLETLSYF